ncbi:MAG: FKBP-type peptidyl-prolyl cis-trans isomerase [Minisyncoccia bacterium]
MTARSITILAIIILIIGGGILYSQFGSSGGEVTETTPTETATTTSQVAGQDITVGTGKEAAPGSLVSVLYVGRLQDGTVFDSSEANGNQPLKFQLGAEGLIPGFQIGINGMKEGGERRIAIPPEFAYGNQEIKDPAGKVVIPANSTIVFDIKLITVEAGSTTPAN